MHKFASKIHDHLSGKASTFSQVMLFIYRSQNAPRQIASVCDFRMQREKRYFILMPRLLRYFRLWSYSSRWSTKFDFLVAFDILAARSIRSHFSRFTTDLLALYNYGHRVEKEKKRRKYNTEAHLKGATKSISIKFYFNCLTLHVASCTSTSTFASTSFSSKSYNLMHEYILVCI